LLEYRPVHSYTLTDQAEYNKPKAGFIEAFLPSRKGRRSGGAGLGSIVIPAEAGIQT